MQAVNGYIVTAIQLGYMLGIAGFSGHDCGGEGSGWPAASSWTSGGG